MVERQSEQMQRSDTIGAVQPRRTDSMPQASLPQRPNYLPEEGEVGRSDFWHLAKAFLVMMLAIAAIGWVLTAIR